MAGYKVVFRMLLIGAVLAGIIAGIYYIIIGASGSKKAYDSYASLKTSEEQVYFDQNFNESSVTMIYVNSADSSFDKYYKLFKTQALVFDEMAQDLYFFEARKEPISAKISSYKNALKDTNEQIKLFLNRKAFFESGGSSGGATITPDETTELNNLTVNITEKFKVQVDKIVNINSDLFDFVYQNYIKDIDGSLKYSILNLTRYQSNLLYKAVSDTEISSAILNKVLNDNNKCYSVYMNEKSNNFVNQTTVNSKEYNFLKNYKTIDDEAKKSFLNSYDKNAFIQARDPTLRTKLGYVMTLMEWGE